MVVLKHMLNFICMIHLTGVSVICLKALLTWQLGIMPVVLHCFLNWLCFYSFCSHEALEGHIQHLACCSFFKTYFCFRKKKETADIFFYYQQMISQSVSGPGLYTIKSRAEEETRSILCMIQPPSVCLSWLLGCFVLYTTNYFNLGSH